MTHHTLSLKNLLQDFDLRHTVHAKMASVMIFAISTFMCAFSMHAEEAGADSVKAAVERWMAEYPESQYADLYKNFFQDSFGPGHLLADKAAARRYLESELASAGAMDGPLLEPTGDAGRFVRVNLSLIRDGVIPIDVFFSAFVRSMENLELHTDDEWRNHWHEIDSIITSMDLSLPEEEADRAVVNQALRSGDFAVHHSERYNDAYARHYRIIRSDIVEKELLPYLNGHAE